MVLDDSIPKSILATAIQCYETHGVVSQEKVELGRRLFRKLPSKMELEGCTDIESAMTCELVIGNREDYQEIIYNGKLFSSPDQAKDYVLNNSL